MYKYILSHLRASERPKFISAAAAMGTFAAAPEKLCDWRRWEYARRNAFILSPWAQDLRRQSRRDSARVSWKNRTDADIHLYRQMSISLSIYIHSYLAFYLSISICSSADTIRPVHAYRQPNIEPPFQKWNMSNYTIQAAEYWTPFLKMDYIYIYRYLYVPNFSSEIDWRS